MKKRAFGINPDSVCDAASKFAEACRSKQFLYSIKHFPGHGDTSSDSHEELPVLDSSADELLRRELIPFQKLISESAPIVMTSHISFPKIDSDYPATLSEKILKGILRDKLGFKGGGHY